MRARRLLALLGGLGALAVGAALVVDMRSAAGGPVVEPFPLALPPLEHTVALARVPDGTLVLSEVTEGEVAGVLLDGDLLDAYGAHGLAGLRSLRDAGPVVRRPLAQLQAPVATDGPHLGAGNNFVDHQEETRVTDEPGLFPKVARPTSWHADVPHASRLDYEVELCAVTLEPVARGEIGPLGFVLCNDVTDRWAMVMAFDPRTPLGTTGFADGKGAPGFLPTGPWMVIPEDPDTFAASVHLRLSVDGRLRQDASQSQAIWQHAEILARAFERCDWDFRYRGEPVAWPACEQVPAGTLVLGGTPGGVVFRLSNVWAGWKYVAPGSVMVAEGTGLGRLVNPVVP